MNKKTTVAFLGKVFKNFDLDYLRSVCIRFPFEFLLDPKTLNTHTSADVRLFLSLILLIKFEISAQRNLSFKFQNSEQTSAFLTKGLTKNNFL